MKLVCISDTHNAHRDIVIPDGDVLVHAGDATMTGTVPEVVDFLDWFRAQPHRHKVLVSGNHDWAFYKRQVAPEWLEGIHYLQDRAVEIEGVRFYGSPWQPWFGGWAFNAERGDELREIWSCIPKDTDVLVTHGPPHGIRDAVMERGPSCGVPGSTRKAIHVGCEELRAAVDRIRPKVHVFGHIHEAYGASVRGPTRFVNASIGYPGRRRFLPIEVTL